MGLLAISFFFRALFISQIARGRLSSIQYALGNSTNLIA